MVASSLLFRSIRGCQKSTCSSLSLWILVVSHVVLQVSSSASGANSSSSDEYTSDKCPDCLPEYSEEYGSTIHPTTPAQQPPNRQQNINDSNSTDWSTMDILVAIFFIVAVGWLLMAIVYSVLILVLLRLQERGELDFYDEDFGLLRLGRMRLRFSCLLRRYAIQLEREQQQRRQRQFGDEPPPVRIMTRDERRLAMEALLTMNKEVSPSNNNSNSSIPMGDGGESDVNVYVDAAASDEGPICTICLGEYEPNDQVFTSNTCSHQFHKECIMDWLERRANTECPCCREPMVSHDDVWDKVKQLRKQRRGQLRRENGIVTRILRWMLGGIDEPTTTTSTTEGLPTTETETTITSNDAVTPASETESDAGSDSTTGGLSPSERPHAVAEDSEGHVQESTYTTTTTTTSDAGAQETAETVAEDSQVHVQESTSTSTSDAGAQETAETDDDDSFGSCLQDAPVEATTDFSVNSCVPLQQVEDSGTELPVSDAGEQESPDKPSCLQDAVAEEDFLEDDMENSTSIMHV